MRRPLVIYDFAPDPFYFPYEENFTFFFSSVENVGRGQRERRRPNRGKTRKRMWEEEKERRKEERKDKRKGKKPKEKVRKRSSTYM